MLKQFLLPPGNLILGLLILLLMLRRRRRACQAVALLGIGMLYALSTPYFAGWLMLSLHWYPPLLPEAATPAEAIVVLSAGRERAAPMYGGDTLDALSLERVRFAARLHRASGLPLLVSGGPPAGPARMPAMATLMAEALVEDFGMPVRWREAASTDTAENAIFSTRLLRGDAIGRFHLVTHGWHLPRAMMAFRAAGLDAIPAPASHRGVPQLTVGALIPSAQALADSAYAMHEWLGMAQYAVRLGVWPVLPSAPG